MLLSSTNALRLLSILSLSLPSWGLPQPAKYSRGPGEARVSGLNPTSRASLSGTGYSVEPSPTGYFSITTLPDTGYYPSPEPTPASFIDANPSPTSSPPVVVETSSPTSLPLPGGGGNSTSSGTYPTGPISGDNEFLRGVNIGGWLVLEKWMNGDVFSGAGAGAADQWTFDSTYGAAEALDRHWASWFTEADVQSLKSYGINAYVFFSLLILLFNLQHWLTLSRLRIPVGYWAFDNAGTPYLKGADAYLEKAIGWAKAAGIKVWVDLHGLPGSQNGWDHSGHGGEMAWQQGDNLQHSTAVLVTVAKKYGAMEYAGTVVGLELVNEPQSSNGNNFETTKQWAKDTYKAVKAVAANPNLMIVMHDAFRGPNSWTDTATSLGPRGAFGIDTHIYQVFSDEEKTLDQPAHISRACGKSQDLGSANAIAPTFVGEWSAATNICVNPDGSTTAGTSCSVYGCQCQSDPIESWNERMVEQVGRYVEAQLDTFEASSSGYFFWSWGGPGPWGFKQGIEKGTIPNPVTSRKYEKQCG